MPDSFDPTADQIAALEKKKQELSAEFTKSVQAINAQLSRLQAITNEVTA